MTRRIDLGPAQRQLAIANAMIARYCDYAEHVEPADANAVRAAGVTVRAVALSLATDLGHDPVALYGKRLDEVERRYVLGIVDSFEAGDHVSVAQTWRDLQLIQGRHDLLYRPDVSGLSRADQLRHCCLHLAKLVGALADQATTTATLRDRVVPDILIFGIKLASLGGEALPTEPLPSSLPSAVDPGSSSAG